jgi:hypothetical protein
MMFLNPLVLLGLAAAAIPLLIHLFNFRRPRKVDFSSLIFLQEVQQRTMQRVRIRQWLLLALRTLAIAAMVLAFARPTMQGGVASLLGARGATSVAIVIDNSLSMNLRDGQGERLARAREVARGIINGLGQNDDVVLVTTAGGSEPGRFAHRGPALDAVAAIASAPGSLTLPEAVARAADALAEAPNPRREIYLLSDLQASLLPDTLRLSSPSGAHVYVVPLGERTYPNVSVEHVEVSSRIVESGRPVRVEATLANHGTESVTGYVAGLYLGEERVAQAAVDIEAGGRAVAVLTGTPTGRGWLTARVEIEDDAFPEDNVYHFSLHVPEERRVLLVRGTGDHRYLQLALSPRLSDGRSAFRLEDVAEGSLASVNLAAYDAVVLAGARGFSSGIVEALGQFVDGGGGLMILPADEAATGAYDRLLARVGGGRIDGADGRAGSGTQTATFGDIDREHPLFAGVFDASQRQVEQPAIFRSVRYRPGSGAEQTLIHMTDRRPFLQEIRPGSGRVLVMTSAADPRWSDLPTRGLFVPLVFRSVAYLSAGDQVTGEQLLAGHAASLRLALGAGARLRLHGPHGEEYHPEQRPVPGATVVDLRLFEPGLYDVFAGERLARRVSVNIPPAESDLRLAAAPAASDIIGEATGLRTAAVAPGSLAPADMLSALERERTGVELWNVFLLLALGFLLAESVVSRQMRRATAAA